MDASAGSIRQRRSTEHYSVRNVRLLTVESIEGVEVRNALRAAQQTRTLEKAGGLVTLKESANRHGFIELER